MALFYTRLGSNWGDFAEAFYMFGGDGDAYAGLDILGVKKVKKNETPKGLVIKGAQTPKPARVAVGYSIPQGVGIIEGGDAIDNDIKKTTRRFADDDEFIKIKNGEKSIAGSSIIVRGKKYNVTSIRQPASR